MDDFSRKFKLVTFTTSRFEVIVMSLILRLCLFQCKIFSGNENIFKCLIAFQKMFWKTFSGVWLCSWKYHRKHIFYLLLTFSQLPNKYIISFHNTETQKKQNPEKKIHQIRLNWEKKEEREATGFDLEVRLCGGGKIERRWSRSLLDRRGAIGAMLRLTRLVRFGVIGAMLRSMRPMECGSSD